MKLTKTEKIAILKLFVLLQPKQLQSIKSINEIKVSLWNEEFKIILPKERYKGSEYDKEAVYKYLSKGKWYVKVDKPEYLEM